MNTRPAGRSSATPAPRRRWCSSDPCRSSSCSASIGEVEVVVLGHPVDDLAQAGRLRPPVPRPPSPHLVRYADRGECTASAATGRRSPGSPGCPRAGSSPPACRAGTRRPGRARRVERPLLDWSDRLTAAAAGRGSPARASARRPRVQLVEQLARPVPAARVAPARRGARRRGVRRAAGGRASAPATSVTSTPSDRRLDQLVRQQVLRLHPGQSHRACSFPWRQAKRTRHARVHRQGIRARASPSARRRPRGCPGRPRPSRGPAAPDRSCWPRRCRPPSPPVRRSVR